MEVETPVLQPIYVGDVAKAIVAILQKEEIDSKIFEIGGAEIFTFQELMNILLKQIKKRRFLIHDPISVSYGSR